jgi:hypothetical protein
MKEHLNAIILAVAILLAVTIYCLFNWNHNRFRLVKTGYKNAFNLIDTKTGEVWCLIAYEGNRYRKYKYSYPKPKFVGPLEPEKKREQKPKNTP